jgi:hypothetical protein
MWDPTVELTRRELHEGRFVEPELDAPPPPETLPEAEVEELIQLPAEPEEGPEPASQ